MNNLDKILEALEEQGVPPEVASTVEIIQPDQYFEKVNQNLYRIMQAAERYSLMLKQAQHFQQRNIPVVYYAAGEVLGFYVPPEAYDETS